MTTKRSETSTLTPSEARGGGEAETHRRPAGRQHDRDSAPCRAVVLAAHLYAVTEAPEPIS
ncbi:unnamed protein product, partial [Gadus morhua 'NCC']